MSYYSEKLKDPRWQKKRLEVFKYDDWTCQRCNETEKPLHIHHLYYIPDTEPWDAPLKSLLTLCEDCHKYETENWSKAIDALIAACQKRCLVDKVMEIAKSILDGSLPAYKDASSRDATDTEGADTLAKEAKSGVYDNANLTPANTGCPARI